ncbi:hypothetical protein K432DRAFT_443659 [Lepidopterella palustris CBS 459.81]|uniref:C2H2-type domain-containing protein n=1 Tax=Lepidopterella palustris CBS 459.81 TaxID=1314670 RepID=A0A8E2E9F7_9PEZI|nr:hypothetical protein K432DRAFT_443659 [Lepidopterella palustris CBS 459.81]
MAPQPTSEYFCGMCDRSFVEKVALQLHISNHLTKQPVSRKTSMANQARSSEGIFNCTKCGSGFNNVETIRQHFRGDHNMINCDIGSCPKSYNSETALKVHKNDVHGTPVKGIAPLPVRRQPSQAPFRQAAPPSRHTSQSYAARPPQASKGVLRLAAPPRNTDQSNTVRPGQAYQAPTLAPAPLRNASQLYTVRPSPRALPTISKSQNVKNTAPTQSTVPATPSNNMATRVANLKQPEDPEYDLPGVIKYKNNTWTDVAPSHHRKAENALEKLCHLPAFLQKMEYLPSPGDGDDEPKSPEDVECFEFSPLEDLAPRRHAVALSCHKVQVTGGKSEIVLLSAIDCLTGEVLINHLVWPNANIDNWQTKITGLTEENVLKAYENGYAILNGWKAAREAVWLVVDADTILVGHALRRTLDALRMIHGRGVDVAIVAQKAASGNINKRDWALPNLCRDFLGFKLQNSPEQGRDCLEHAFAAREVVFWMIKNLGKLAAWGTQKSEEYLKEAELLKKTNELSLDLGKKISMSGEI